MSPGSSRWYTYIGRPAHPLVLAEFSTSKRAESVGTCDESNVLLLPASFSISITPLLSLPRFGFPFYTHIVSLSPSANSFPDGHSQVHQEHLKVLCTLYWWRASCFTYSLRVSFNFSQLLFPAVGCTFRRRTLSVFPFPCPLLQSETRTRGISNVLRALLIRLSWRL